MGIPPASIRTNLPVFRVPEATVRRRYSDFKVSNAIDLYLTSARLVPINFKRKLP
jgi:hypothetical protein